MEKDAALLCRWLVLRFTASLRIQYEFARVAPAKAGRHMRSVRVM